jgi:ElaB/YqjD/DUF883 family membrane-anchored ribosome-binding protein
MELSTPLKAYPGNSDSHARRIRMSTSTASHAREAARDTASDAREGLREVSKAASAASTDIQKDLQALRDDLARLAEQVGEIVAAKGNAAWRRAKKSVDGVVSDAQDKSRDAAHAVRDVSDNFVDAVDESIKNRPYATLALVAGLGFIFGAAWRR